MVQRHVSTIIWLPEADPATQQKLLDRFALLQAKQKKLKWAEPPVITLLCDGKVALVSYQLAKPTTAEAKPKGKAAIGKLYGLHGCILNDPILSNPSLVIATPIRGG